MYFFKKHSNFVKAVEDHLNNYGKLEVYMNCWDYQIIHMLLCYITQCSYKYLHENPMKLGNIIKCLIHVTIPVYFSFPFLYILTKW